MEENKNLDSVRDEQFGSDNKETENTENTQDKMEESKGGDNQEVEKEASDENDTQEQKPAEEIISADKEPLSDKPENQEPEKTSASEGKVDKEVVENQGVDEDDSVKNPVKTDEQTDDQVSDKASDKNIQDIKEEDADKKALMPAEEADSKPSDAEASDNAAQSEPEKVSEDTSDKPSTTDKGLEEKQVKGTGEKSSTKEEKSQEEEKPVREKPDYTELGKEDLIKEFAMLLEMDDIPSIKDDIDTIKSSYEKASADELRRLKKNFLAEGGVAEDFKPQEDPNDFRFKDLLQAYRDKKTAYYKNLESEKEKNLEEKYTIIEEIKDLINRKESLNKTFNEFNDLQARWRDTGLVPQANVKELWETYHHHVEKFYDYIKINKELRDLDFKKNLETKTTLCEKAEELLLEPNIIEAFRTLQTYHDQWREIGPVPPDMRSAIWERFKEATSKINKKHQEHFENLKDQQKNNLEQKTLLCEKAEEIAARENNSFKDWDKQAQELKELQRIWKTIGFAPRKDNNAIYERFRLACDTFFNRKRDFFAHHREEQQNNLQLKTDLCIQAEALKDSTDWRKTTDDLIKLQKRWKEIGPVPRKHSDAIWKRFRAACDDFFNRKADYYSNIDTKYEDNLKEKEALIAEIKAYDIDEDAQIALKKLKDFQRRWADIGFVPIKEKDRIQQEYRSVINDKFDHLKIDERKKNIIKYKSKLEDLSQKPKATVRMRQDREKYLNKLKQLENDIVLWENNIGFFSNSKNAEKMIQEVENKITNARKNIELLKQKIVMIEETLDDFE